MCNSIDNRSSNANFKNEFFQSVQGDEEIVNYKFSGRQFL